MVTVLKIDERAMNLDHSYIAGGNIKGNSHSKKHFGSFFKKKSHNYHTTQKLYFWNFIPRNDDLSSRKILKTFECSLLFFKFIFD